MTDLIANMTDKPEKGGKIYKNYVFFLIILIYL